MKREIGLFLFILCAAAVLTNMQWARRPAAPDRLCLNGIWVGESKEEVEATLGEGSDVPGYLYDTCSYPKGADEHIVLVHFENKRVHGVRGYTLKKGDFESSVSGRLTAMFEEFGQPEQVKVYRNAEGGSAEFRFKGDIHVTTVLKVEANKRLTLPDVVDAIALSPPPSIIAVRPYGGDVQIRKRPDQSGEVTIYCDGLDILL